MGARLSQQEQERIRDLYAHGMQISEIASALSRSRNAIYNALHRNVAIPWSRRRRKRQIELYSFSEWLERNELPAKEDLSKVHYQNYWERWFRQRCLDGIPPDMEPASSIPLGRTTRGRTSECPIPDMSYEDIDFDAS